MGKRQYKQTQAIRQGVRDLVETKGTIDQEVFLADLIEVFGGSRKLAVAMHKEFQGAPEGGLVRQKMLQCIQHLIISTTSMNLTKVVSPQDLSDQDLDDQIGDYLEKIEARRLVPPPRADAEPRPEASGRDAVAPLAGEAVELGDAGS